MPINNYEYFWLYKYLKRTCSISCMINIKPALNSVVFIYNPKKIMNTHWHIINNQGHTQVSLWKSRQNKSCLYQQTLITGILVLGWVKMLGLGKKIWAWVKMLGLGESFGFRWKFCGLWALHLGSPDGKSCNVAPDLTAGFKGLEFFLLGNPLDMPSNFYFQVNCCRRNWSVK